MVSFSAELPWLGGPGVRGGSGSAGSREGIAGRAGLVSTSEETKAGPSLAGRMTPVAGSDGDDIVLERNQPSCVWSRLRVEQPEREPT